MNKAHRHEQKMLKLKKRLKQLGLTHSVGNFYAYRSHGKPCSCGICSYTKYNRNNPKSKRGGLITKDYMNNSLDASLKYDEYYEA